MRNLVAVFYINWSLAFFNLCVIWLFSVIFLFSCFKPLATCKSQVAAARKMRLPGASPKHIPTYTNTLIPIFLHIQIHSYPCYYTYKYTQNFLLHILTFRITGISTNCTFCCEGILVVTSSSQNEIHSYLVYSKLKQLHSNFGFQIAIPLHISQHVFSCNPYFVHNVSWCTENPGQKYFWSLQQCTALWFFSKYSVLESVLFLYIFHAPVLYLFFFF